MRNKDFHNIIERQEPEKKAAKYEEFRRKHAVEPTKRVWTYKRLSLIAAAACMICIIIALPFMLNKLPDDVGGGGGNIGIITPPIDIVSGEYFTTADCVAQNLNCNLGEYALRSDKPLLHVDMYEETNEVKTQKFVSKKNSAEVVYLYEQISTPGKKEVVDLFITDKKTNVDILNEIEKKCVKKCIINNVDVNWFDEKYGEHLAAFEYEDYKYYVSSVRSSESGEADPYILGFVMSMLFSNYSLK